MKLIKYICIWIILFVVQYLQMQFSDSNTVYCLMVTGHNEQRYAYAKISIKNFHFQTYTNKKLIIINQNPKPLITREHKNILEVFIDKTDKSLGALRNISLSFVPPNAYWTPWDDDDWRHPNYISIMMKKMLNKNVQFLMYQNRLEMNHKNNFCFKTKIISGTMQFFAKNNPYLKYEDINVLEDVKLKKFALNNLKTYVYDNDPSLYIRTIHDENTSNYVNNEKTEIRDTKHHKEYFENEVEKEEREYAEKILSTYYSNV